MNVYSYSMRETLHSDKQQTELKFYNSYYIELYSFFICVKNFLREI